MGTQSLFREPAPRFINYHLLPIDTDLGAVASRYGVTLAAIREATMRFSRAQLFVLPPASLPLRAAGPAPLYVVPPQNLVEWVPADRNIVIPLPAREAAVEWLAVRVVGSATLDQVCAEHNANAERRAARMTALTPRELWGYAINFQFRQAVLEKHAGEDLHAIETNPGPAVAPDHAIVYVPYPKQAGGAAIHAVPNPSSSSAAGAQPNTTTVHPAPPPWVLELYATLNFISAQTELLRAANDRAKSLTEDGARAILNLAVLRSVLSRYEPGSHVATLDAALQTLQNQATPVLAMRPLQYADPDGHTARVAVARALLNKLEEPRFKELTALNLAAEAHGIPPWSPFPMLCLFQREALHELSRSPLAKETMHLVDTALDAQRAAVVSGAAQTSLSTLLATLGAVTQVAGATVGNLPGPASLSSLSFELWVTDILPKIAAGKVDRTTAMGKFKYFMTKVGGVTEAELAELETVTLGADANAVKAKIASLTEKAKGRFQGSKGWGGALLVLNAYSLAAAFFAPERYVARGIANITSSTINGAMALKQMMGAFAEGGSLATGVNAAIAKGLGYTAAIASIIVGAITIYEGAVTGDDAILAAGALATAGGVLSAGCYVLAAFEIITPELAQAIGLVYIVGSAVVGNWEEIKNMFTTGVERVFAAQLASFAGCSTMMTISLGWFHGAADKWDAELSSGHDAFVNAYKGVLDALQETALPALRNTDENRSFLSELGFSPDDVDSLCESILQSPITRGQMGLAPPTA